MKGSKNFNKVINFWKMIEFFHQSDYAEKKEEHTKRIRICHDIRNADIEQLIENDKEEYKEYEYSGNTICYYVGRIQREKCIEIITQKLKESTDEELKKSTDFFPEKNFSEIACFSFKTTGLGYYEKNSFELSPVLWGMYELSRNNKRGEIELSEDSYKYVLSIYNNSFITAEKIDSKFIFGIYEEILKNMKELSDSVESKKEGVMVYYRYKNEKDAENEQIPYRLLFRDFYIKDLELFSSFVNSGEYGKNLYQQKFLTYVCALSGDEEFKVNTENRHNISEKEKETKEGREKVASLLKEWLHIKKTPLGKWPSKFSLVLMQQLAVNLAVSEEEGVSEIFSVNGPPGTGKTTMLKEIIANNIVERARLIAMSELNSSDDMFISVYNNDNKNEVCCYKLENDEINKYGMLVVSNNNGAVENITKKLPEELEFPDFQKQEKDSLREISAPLGKKQNIDKYCSNILRPLINDYNKQDFIPSHQKNYSEVREKFKEQLKKVEEKRKELIQLYEKEDECEELTQLKEELQETEKGLSSTYESRDYKELEQLVERVKSCEDEISELKKEIYDTEREIAALERTHTFFNSFLHFLGRKPKKEKLIEKYKADCTEKEERIKKLQKEKELLPQRDISAKKLIGNLKEKKKELETKIKQYNSQKKKVQMPPDDEFMDDYFSDEIEKSTKAQVSNVWTTPEYDYEREKLFYLACQLQKEFVLSSECCKDNLNRILTIWESNARGDENTDYVFPALLQTVFLLTPVISTTFASVQRFLEHVKKPGELGTLIIDEAGQAQPHMAVGALFRCRKSIIVGDPKQIEPIVTGETNLFKNIMCKGALAQYKNKNNSVQTFADNINMYGTYIKGTWVGCPLVVHRRCLDPMYQISNELFYDNLMKQKTALPEKEREDKFCLRSSYWINVKGKEKDSRGKNHFVAEQGDVVIELLRKAFKKHSSELPDIFIITPFNSVKREIASAVSEVIPKLKPALKKEDLNKWVEHRIGTVHTFQGKEADEVILLLGCDKNSSGTVRWVNDNLINVAITRAKYRLYIIGDRAVWRESALMKAVDEKIYKNNKEKCQQCGKETVVIRVNSNNKHLFYGCSRYPNCKWSEDIR